MYSRDKNCRMTSDEFCCVLHTIFSHSRAHAFAGSVTRLWPDCQPYRLRLLGGRKGGGPSSVAPRSRNPPTGRRRDSPISSSLFSHGPPLCAVTCVRNISQVPGPGVCHTDCIQYEMHRQQCQCTVTMFNRLFLCYFQTDMLEIAYNYKLAAIILST